MNLLFYRCLLVFDIGNRCGYVVFFFRNVGCFRGVGFWVFGVVGYFYGVGFWVFGV